VGLVIGEIFFFLLYFIIIFLYDKYDIKKIYIIYFFIYVWNFQNFDVLSVIGSTRKRWSRANSGLSSRGFHLSLSGGFRRALRMTHMTLDDICKCPVYDACFSVKKLSSY
jgi:hypothetical protein